MTKAKRIVVIGGGLGGLTAAILLQRKGFEVVLFERKAYPFHRVCGEYISNETVPFLKAHGLYPQHLQPPIHKKFTLSNIKGDQAHLPLNLGGFGVSRYAFDQWLVGIANAEGVQVMDNTQVTNVEFREDAFEITYDHQEVITASLVLGAYGKRSKLDKTLDRPFIKKKSPFIGVKYHIKTDFAPDTIALYNFPGGYCGLSKVEGDRFNLCYLSRRENLKAHGNIATMEEEIVQQNPHLKAIYQNSEFLFEKPEVINEISFERKAAVENHILMVGDAAGLITPLCGNGMAMAIHAAKLAADTTAEYWSSDQLDRAGLEQAYSLHWKKIFARRLWVGRNSQRLFGNHFYSGFAVNLMRYARPLAHQIIEQTHGKVF